MDAGKNRMENQYLIAQSKPWQRLSARRDDRLNGLGRRTRPGERLIQGFLFLCGFLTIITTLAIVIVLGREALRLVTSEYVTESGAVYTEIGRASCRESGERSVGAGAVKKECEM